MVYIHLATASRAKVVGFQCGGWAMLPGAIDVKQSCILFGF